MVRHSLSNVDLPHPAALSLSFPAVNDWEYMYPLVIQIAVGNYC